MSDFGDAMYGSRGSTRNGEIRGTHRTCIESARSTARCTALRRLRFESLEDRMVLSHFAHVFTDINPNNSDLDFVGNPDPSNPSGPDADGSSGGRINGLAAVPGNNNIFYAASEWGGLFKSTDQGITWSHLDGHEPKVTWDVEVDPGNTNRVFATSFYDGRVDPISGIQVSNDAGVTWTHPVNAAPPAGFCLDDEGDGVDDRRLEPSAFGISIRPDAPNNVVIGTNCGVAISTDSGGNWTFVDPTPLTNATDVWDVVFQPAQAGFPQGIIDIIGDDGHLRSIDGGANWIPNTGIDNLDNDGDALVDEADEVPFPPGMGSIAVSPDESYVLLATASDTNLYESNDAGQNWTNLGDSDAVRAQGRIPFVATNDRTVGFDLWTGDVGLYRVVCNSQAAPGGANRCSQGIVAGTAPVPPGWSGPFTRVAGSHDDVGDVVFDSQVAVDAMPMIMSSDGGVYRNVTPALPPGWPCSFAGPCTAGVDLVWEQPNISPHALWIFGMDGVDRPGVANEEIYFGLQDDGSWVSVNAGAAVPTWSNKDCCDAFDVVANQQRVVYDICCGFTAFQRNTGMVGGGAINLPAGNAPAFFFPDFIDDFGPNQYVAVTTGAAGGAFFTNNITATPVVWNQIAAGTSPANGFCGVQASVSGGTPSFFAQVGCSTDQSNQLWGVTGTAGGNWQRLDANIPDGIDNDTDGTIDEAGEINVGGVGIFAVDPNNPNRLYASSLPGTGPRMVFSTDGGQTWNRDSVLDTLMTGAGAFQYQTQRGFSIAPGSAFTQFRGYPQPSLLAFDPENNNVIGAGGQDSGVFISTDSGQTWRLLTDPIGSDPGNPHLPRPRFAHFDHEPAGTTQLYVGTQGRGGVAH